MGTPRYYLGARGGSTQRALEAFNADLACKMAPKQCRRPPERPPARGGGVGGGGSGGGGSASSSIEALLEAVEAEHSAALRRTEGVLQQQQRAALDSLRKEQEGRVKRLRAEFARSGRGASGSRSAASTSQTSIGPPPLRVYYRP